MRPFAEIDEEIAGCRRAHAGLLEDVGSLDDHEARRSSELPGWSVGHVLTHLARNADSYRRVFEAAAAGSVAERYPGGAAQRDGDIERGSSRSAALLVQDLREASAALEGAWATCTTWDAAGSHRGSRAPLSELPFSRWREVEVHHADLGLGFTFDDWSAGYVRRDLRRGEMVWRASHPMGLTGLPAAALALAPNRRLAWLAGRLEVDGLPAPPSWM